MTRPPKRCKGCKQYEGFGGFNKDGYCPDCVQKMAEELEQEAGARTVEAIQAHLQGYGVVLFPGDPNDPPPRISDLELTYLQPRKFKVADPNGPVFEYKHIINLYLWELVSATDSRTNREPDKQTAPGD